MNVLHCEKYICCGLFSSNLCTETTKKAQDGAPIVWFLCLISASKLCSLIVPPLQGASLFLR